MKKCEGCNEHVRGLPQIKTDIKGCIHPSWLNIHLSANILHFVLLFFPSSSSSFSSGGKDENGDGCGGLLPTAPAPSLSTSLPLSLSLSLPLPLPLSPSLSPSFFFLLRCMRVAIFLRTRPMSWRARPPRVARTQTTRLRHATTRRGTPRASPAPGSPRCAAAALREKVTAEQRRSACGRYN